MQIGDSQRGNGRAIGVINRPESERLSHYFRARLADQFDALLHFDRTRALEPLERTAGWERGDLPDVSRGGRPDLAGPALPRVTAPTLLIVGGLDLPVIDMNAAAQRQMRAETKPEIVPGASHLFEEPGTLDQAALLARDWFLRCLASAHETGRGSAA